MLGRMTSDDDRIPRRDLLTLAAAGAGALVLGLDRLALADDGWEQGAWDAALRAMRAGGQHGVAVVLPAGAEARAALAARLAELIPLVKEDDEAPLPPAGAWFVECVWLLAAPARVEARPGETLVLLAPDGKRVAGAAVPLDDPAAFARGVEALVAGEGRLAARAGAATDEVKKAIEAYLSFGEGGDVQRSNDARVWLLDHLDRAGSAVVHRLRTTKDDADRDALAQLLQWGLLRRARQETGLPFGIKWKVLRTDPEPCPPCGMARPTVDGRKFLEFWGK